MCAYDPTETYKKISFRNIPHKVRLWKIEKILQNECRGKNVTNYVDIGCASGFITHRIKQLLRIPHAYGTDALSDYIKDAAQKYPDISFGIMNLNTRIAVNKEYDLVTCFETLEHVGRLETALSNIHQLTAVNGGICVISVPIETGFIGIIKYLLKVKIYRDKLNEIGEVHQKQYFKSLLKGEDISKYRNPQKDLWWDHFGFNDKTLENYFTKRNIKYKTKTFFTTRFIIINN